MRALSQILENTVYSFASILSVYLFGTALGSAIYQAWSPRLSFRVVMGCLAQGLALACMTGLSSLIRLRALSTRIRNLPTRGCLSFSTPSIRSPTKVLGPLRDAEDTETQKRLAACWTACDQFLRVGVAVKETDDVQQLLSQLKEPLLAIVRQSRDFDAAYNPLLAMAYQLCKIDAKGAEQLLVDLEKANPSRDDVRLLLLRTGALCQ